MLLYFKPPSGAAVPADYPAESDVKIGVEYDHGDMVGTLDELTFDTRQSFNRILKFIGSPTLTDDEYEGLSIDGDSTALEIYEGLDALLTTRESVSTLHDRLKYYFFAKGVAVSAPTLGSSQILVGGAL